jgi:L-asparaginase
VTLPRIAVIATGGTIESVGKDRLDLAWYPATERRLEEGELIASVPEVTQIADIIQLPTRGSPREMTIADWLRILDATQRATELGVDGIVVTAGTNPLDELAYFLHLAAKTTRPIVVTGAMRPSSGLGADGPLNLVNAVRVASSPDAVGLGVLVVMNESIYSARDVTKSNTHRVHAFVARDTGPVGYADADRITMLHRPVRPHTLDSEFAIAGRTDLPRVDIVVSYVGADEALIDAAVAAGARGLVSAGSGAGRPGARENAAFDRAVLAGVTVCQASRVGSGRVTLSPWLVRRGLVAAGDLQPWKARVLLMLALTVTTDRTAIQRLFDTY